MATVVEKLVSQLGFDYDPKGIKRHDADVKKSTETLAQNEAKGRSWGKTLAGAGKMAAAGLLAVGAAAASAAAAAAKFGVGASVEFAKVGDEVAKTSVKLGVSTDALQKMRFAAGRSGASSEALSVALKTLNRQMQDASVTGKGPLVDALGQIGLEVKDLEGLAPEQRMGLLADALRRVEDPSRKSALAMKIFGEQGTALVPMLKEGSAGLARLYGIASQQPDFLSPEQTKEAERLNDALGDMHGALKGAYVQIGAALAPAVSEIVEYITTWVRENQQFIRQDLPKVLGGVTTAAKMLVEQIAFAVDQWRFLIIEGQRWASWAEEKVPGITSALTSAFEAVIAPIDTLMTALDGLLARLDDVAAYLGIIEDNASGLRSLLGIDDTPTTTVRGAPAFLGETAEGRAKRMEDKSPQQLMRIITDPAQPLSEKQAAQSAMAASSKRYQAAQRTVGQVSGQLQALSAKAGAMFFGDGTRGPIAAAGPSRGGRVGGGRGASAATEEMGPSIDELINGLGSDGKSMRDVLDAARFGPSAIRQTPLEGAQIVRVDASFRPVTSISIDIPASAMNESTQDYATRVRDLLQGWLAERDRQAFQHYDAAVRI